MNCDRFWFWSMCSEPGYQRPESGHGQPMARLGCFGGFGGGIAGIAIIVGSAGIAVAGG